MFRALLLLLALALGALGLLTVFQAPAWTKWQLAVLAGEYGHWLALAALLVAGVARVTRGAPGQHGLLVGGTILAGIAAAVLLLKPAFQAWRVGAGLPAEFAAQFPSSRGGELDRVPFSLGQLLGSNPEPVAPLAREVAPGLPFDFYPAVAHETANGQAGRPAPCVIVIHGGGWDSGDRTQLPHFHHWLARQGYAVAAISYRLAPQFPWPAQREDVRTALAYLKAHATELGFDPTRLVLLGRSAGGQIAETFGYAVHDPAVRGMIALYAPSDLVFAYENAEEDDMLHSPELMRKFLDGPPEQVRANYESASALRFVTRDSPPTLLLHGANDALVWHRHSVRLAAKLKENGVPHVFVSLPWATHAFEFNLHGPGGQLTTYAIERFLAAVTR